MYFCFQNSGGGRNKFKLVSGDPSLRVNLILDQWKLILLPTTYDQKIVKNRQNSRAVFSCSSSSEPSPELGAKDSLLRMWFVLVSSISSLNFSLSRCKVSYFSWEYSRFVVANTVSLFHV